jgi:hypothetical protein
LRIVLTAALVRELEQDEERRHDDPVTMSRRRMVS